MIALGFFCLPIWIPAQDITILSHKDGDIVTSTPLVVDWRYNGKDSSTEFPLDEGLSLIVVELQTDSGLFKSNPIWITKTCLFCLVVLHTPPKVFYTNNPILPVIWSVNGKLQSRRGLDTLVEGPNTVLRSIKDFRGNNYGDSSLVYLDIKKPSINPSMPVVRYTTDSIYLNSFSIQDGSPLGPLYLVRTDSNGTNPDTVSIPRDSLEQYRVSWGVTEGKIPRSVFIKDTAGNYSSFNEFDKPVMNLTDMELIRESDKIILSRISIVDSSLRPADSSAGKRLRVELTQTDAVGAVTKNTLALNTMTSDSTLFTVSFTHKLNWRTHAVFRASDVWGNESSKSDEFHFTDSTKPTFLANGPVKYKTDSVTAPSFEIRDGNYPPFFVYYLYKREYAQRVDTLRVSIGSATSVPEISFGHGINKFARLEILLRDAQGNEVNQQFDLNTFWKFSSNFIGKPKEKWQLIGIPYSMRLSELVNRLSMKDEPHHFERVQGNAFESIAMQNLDTLLPAGSSLLFGSLNSSLEFQDTLTYSAYPSQIIYLKKGWNLVTCPFPTTQGIVPDPTRNNGPVVYRLNSSSWEVSTILNPYEGYAVYTSLDTDSLSITAAGLAKTQVGAITTLSETHSNQAVQFSNQYSEVPFLKAPGSTLSLSVVSENRDLLLAKSDKLLRKKIRLSASRNTRIHMTFSSLENYQSAVLLDESGNNLLGREMEIGAGEKSWTLLAGPESDVKKLSTMARTGMAVSQNNNGVVLHYSFGLEPKNLELSVHSASGRLVDRISLGREAYGEVRYENRGLTDGVYLFRIASSGFSGRRLERMVPWFP